MWMQALQGMACVGVTQKEELRSDVLHTAGSNWQRPGAAAVMCHGLAGAQAAGQGSPGAR